MAKKSKIQRFWHALAALLGGGMLVVLCVLGWQWLSALRVERIVVTGAQYAAEEALLELARVDTGWAMLDVDPALVEDRLRRHPWVEAVDATRLPTGTLALTVHERTPVVLVLDRQGRPAYFLDRVGAAMPLVPGAAYDVPLLRGLRESYHPVRAVQSPAIRDLLRALANAGPDEDALISELEVEHSGQIRLYTTPTGTRGAIPVRLGRDEFADKLDRLRAFWYQAVLTQPEKTFTLIDLRFNSQIVTREE